MLPAGWTLYHLCVILQSPYNVVRYEIMEDSAEMFLVDEVSGEVFLKQPLYTDDPEITEYTVWHQ